MRRPMRGVAQARPLYALPSPVMARAHELTSLRACPSPFESTCPSLDRLCWSELNKCWYYGIIAVNSALTKCSPKHRKPEHSLVRHGIRTRNADNEYKNGGFTLHF
ncbi:hypothetical protein EJ04DRAFT_309448 [Polyplosphaeria fusca]|uniref:Uncharacterized protein n=1 Tax=Polyplosphaeria fusca TaxID=682080 RepID=A0A9P4V7J7_9PLEO|nr:hypothetical protein EJ04DRAFT_309448 [Polyplosphaeria fusca]